MAAHHPRTPLEARHPPPLHGLRIPRRLPPRPRQLLLPQRKPPLQAVDMPPLALPPRSPRTPHHPRTLGRLHSPPSHQHQNAAPLPSRRLRLQRPRPLRPMQGSNGRTPLQRHPHGLAMRPARRRRRLPRSQRKPPPHRRESGRVHGHGRPRDRRRPAHPTPHPRTPPRPRSRPRATGDRTRQGPRGHDPTRRRLRQGPAALPGQLLRRSHGRPRSGEPGAAHTARRAAHRPSPDPRSAPTPRRRHP